jgi:hypothetical protein
MNKASAETGRVLVALAVAAVLTALFLLVFGFLALYVPVIAALVYFPGSWAVPLASHLFYHGNTPERAELILALFGDALIVFILLAVHLVRSLHWGKTDGSETRQAKWRCTS